MGLHVGRLVGESHLHLEVDQHVRKPLQHTLHEAFGRLRAGGCNRRRAPLALGELHGRLCSHREGRQSGPHGTGSAGLQRIGHSEQREERSHHPAVSQVALRGGALPADKTRGGGKVRTRPSRSAAHFLTHPLQTSDEPGRRAESPRCATSNALGHLSVVGTRHGRRPPDWHLGTHRLHLPRPGCGSSGVAGCYHRGNRRAARRQRRAARRGAARQCGGMAARCGTGRRGRGAPSICRCWRASSRALPSSARRSR